MKKKISLLPPFASVLLFINLTIILTAFYSKVFNKPVYLDSEFRSYFSKFVNDGSKYGVKVDSYRLITIFSNDENFIDIKNKVNIKYINSAIKNKNNIKKNIFNFDGILL